MPSSHIEAIFKATADIEAAAELAETELMTCGERYPGDPGPGMALVGGAVGFNADPSARESFYGRRLGIRRTYFRADQVTQAVSTASSDLTLGRLPWISLKFPTSWANVAAGQADTWALDLADKLAALPGPVWVTLHHEPEGDEGTTAADMQRWVAAQRRMSPFFDRPNVAFWVIYTGWSQFFGTNPAYHLSNVWPGDDVGIKGIGIDPYCWYGTADGKPMGDMEADYWTRMELFANAHQVAWGVAETGYTAAAHTANPKWLQQSFDRMLAHGGAAYCYFDLKDASRPTWTWQLDASRAAAFKSVINQANSGRI